LNLKGKEAQCLKGSLEGKTPVVKVKKGKLKNKEAREGPGRRRTTAETQERNKGAKTTWTKTLRGGWKGKRGKIHSKNKGDSTMCFRA